MQPGDNVYRDAVIRIAQPAEERGVLEGSVFEGSDLKGLAMVVPQGSNFASTNLVGDSDALLWEISPERTEVIGVLLV